MGVKDLWQVLAPVCDRKTLWELHDKIIAVDLSAWVCDSQNVAEYSSQPNMYLRNIFFRTSALLLLGAVPVFVLEGIAPEMKASVMQQRNAARGFIQTQKISTQQAEKGKRRNLKSIEKKCCELFKCIGVKFVESAGEAEALCALLNKNGLVAGCISQDSDCFLYGAETVYRNFSSTAGNSSTGGPGFSIDLYSMASIKECLGLTRNKLIALSLLCGCDYLQQGVAGVGKENALKFLSSVEDAAILDRLRQWRGDNYYEQLEKERSVGGCEQCGHIGKKRTHLKEGCVECGLDRDCIPSYNPQALCQMESEQKKTLITELSIRKKALLDPDFPSEEIIREFLSPNIPVPTKIDTQWDQPDLVRFLKFADRYLNWDEVYAFNKFLPVITRWVLLKKGNAPERVQDSCPLYPVEIIKPRVLRGIASYEIKWADTMGLFDSIAKTAQESQTDITLMFCTIEPQNLAEQAFPDLVHSYVTQVEEAKRAKRKGKSKSKKKGDTAPDSNKTRCEICGGCDGCLCSFTNLEPKTNSRLKTGNDTKKSKKRLRKNLDDKSQTRLSPFVQKVQKEALTLNTSLEEMFNTSLTLNDDQNYGEADLSAIVLGIVGPEAYYKDVSEESPQSLPESVDPSQKSETRSPNSVSSDDEYQTYIPLLQRIKMKTESQKFQDVCSPDCKKSRRTSNSPKHPYSPLARAPSFDVPPPNRRRSVICSKAAKRFSTSLQAFLRSDVSQETPSETSLHSSSDLDDRFDLGVTGFLNSQDE